MDSQPVMVKKRVKGDDYAPMEVDQICHEDAEISIMQEDYQPLEFDIDEDLDDPSQSFFIQNLYYIDTQQVEFSELAKISANDGEVKDDCVPASESITRCSEGAP